LPCPTGQRSGHHSSEKTRRRKDNCRAARICSSSSSEGQTRFVPRNYPRVECQPHEFKDVCVKQLKTSAEDSARSNYWGGLGHRSNEQSSHKPRYVSSVLLDRFYRRLSIPDSSRGFGMHLTSLASISTLLTAVSVISSPSFWQGSPLLGFLLLRRWQHTILLVLLLLAFVRALHP